MPETMQIVEDVDDFQAQVGKDLGRQAAAKVTSSMTDILQLCENPHQMVQVYTTVLQTVIKSGYPFALDLSHTSDRSRYTAQAVIALMMLLRERHPVVQDFLDKTGSRTFNLSHALRVLAKVAEKELLIE